MLSSALLLLQYMYKILQRRGSAGYALYALQVPACPATASWTSASYKTILTIHSYSHRFSLGAGYEKDQVGDFYFPPFFSKRGPWWEAFMHKAYHFGNHNILSTGNTRRTLLIASVKYDVWLIFPPAYSQLSSQPTREGNMANISFDWNDCNITLHQLHQFLLIVISNWLLETEREVVALAPIFFTNIIIIWEHKQNSYIVRLLNIHHT